MKTLLMAKVQMTTQQRIFKAACQLFSEQGFEKVSIRAIAEKAKSKLGSIYYYYENKETLYLEVFRNVYDLQNALTYDVLLTKEPLVLDTPEGKAYAIQRVVFDYFHRHIFTPEEWRKKLILRELYSQSPIFFQLVEEVLGEEAKKMMEFYYLLSPDGTPCEAYYWSHLPDTQGLYYLMSSRAIEKYHDKKFLEELSQTIIKNTTKLMISLLHLPIPGMLE